MKRREYFNYQNPVFAPLRDPMRRSVQSLLTATQHYASIKEIVWGRFGMAYLSDAIHVLEHLQPERIDKLSKAMREQGLEIEYPSVKEFTDELDILEEVFKVCIELTNQIEEALQSLIDTADGKVASMQTKFPALAREVEALQIENSSDRTKLLECWNMWDNKPSMSSFDKWVKSRFDLEDDGEGDD